jgi:hypothetical protein
MERGEDFVAAIAQLFRFFCLLQRRSVIISSAFWIRIQLGIWIRIQNPEKGRMAPKTCFELDIFSGN